MPFQGKRGTLALAALLVSTAYAAHAQAAARPAQMPTEFAMGLLGSGVNWNTSKTTFLVDSFPLGWPPALVLRSAHLLGGAKTDVGLVTVYADTSRRAYEDFREVLVTNGFTERPLEGRGFSMGGPVEVAYCRGSARMRPVSTPGLNGRKLLTVSFELGEGESCADPAANSLGLPALKAPPGVTAIDVATSATMSEVRSQTRLASMHPPSVLLAHYAAQLSAAGWTVGMPAFSSTLAGMSLETRDRVGRYWYGSLVITSGGDIRDLQLTMRNDRF